jgi:hypothetical protein
MSTIIDMYEQILNKQRIKFTQGTWENGGHDNFRRCLRYLVLEKLQYSRSEFLEEVSFQFIKKWRLAAPAQMLYNYHTLNIANEVFPEWDIKGWEIRMVPPNFWNDETIKEAIRHFILNKLKWSREDLVSKFTSGMLKASRYYEAMVRFRDYGLYEKVGKQRSSAYALLLYCFPEYNLKIWEFKNTMEYWDEEDIRGALIWLFREKLEWSEKEIKSKITKQVFVENNFGQFFHTFFRGSTFRVMKFLYPNDDWEHLKRNKDKNFPNKPDYSFILYNRQ